MSPLSLFAPAVQDWFTGAFPSATKAQLSGWPAIARGDSTLILAPTGSGKTLAAFLWSLNRVMFSPAPDPRARCRLLYVSPLKALAVDVEQNLRVPLAGIAAAATARGDAFLTPSVMVRTGDTPQRERARFARGSADILITTPESLYLLLTSNARQALRAIDTVIIDEIHALVPTKRGAHLMLSIERLEALTGRPLQRIGLSATQRPLDEVARFLGGATTRATNDVGGRPRGQSRGRPPKSSVRAQVHDQFTRAGDRIRYRPVTIVDASTPRKFALRIEVPVEDLRRIDTREEVRAANRPRMPGTPAPNTRSIWTAIHPHLLDLIRRHRTTLVFVNSRRTSERLAGALNDLAGEALVRAHHGSLAREQRTDVEAQLKAGLLRGLIATSSLELGIDMGSIDLVVQIEAPPSVASALQRIGRSGHQVGGEPAGIIVPKFRGDLVACAAVASAMRTGQVEATRYPRNPLDVLAQQIVAMTAVEEWQVDTLFDAIRGAAPFASLSCQTFEGVLDMLSGRYPSDEFADLRPRVTWNRTRGTVVAREGSKRVAILNGGTIPDRGLYGVFLTGATPGAARVGELDEEMVFETRVGETFVLGASTWRVDEITHDRVLVTPAPGEPGKVPFWKGEAPSRPLELGQSIGALMRTLRALPPAAALDRLERQHSLDRGAAENLLAYLTDQVAATHALPDDRTIVIERTRDELGDWRVSVLCPFGGRVLTPWAMAASERIRATLGIDVETMWTDDGFVVRFPDMERAPDATLLMPSSREVEDLVITHLSRTALFAAKFREAAGRALLLPRRRAGQRSPLWQQRKRAYDLLTVAARFGSFPMILETYRECLRDVFDIPALVDTLRRIERQEVQITIVDPDKPSPFAASLMFGYVATFLYDGDAPLAERRAQALSVDYSQLRELVGEADLRELLDADTIRDVEQQRQHLVDRDRVRSVDALHDLLLAMGDLTTREIAARSRVPDLTRALGELVAAHRVVDVRLGGDERWIAAEYAGRYHHALGVELPAGLPASLRATPDDPRGDLARRFSRTRGPFLTVDFAERYGLGVPDADATLARLGAIGVLIPGEFRSDQVSLEWCDRDVLRLIRQRSLAKARRDVEPVEPRILARLVTTWQGVTHTRRGLDALLDAVEQLQGAALLASALETELLPARIDDYDPAMLDALAAAGEIVWCGVEPVGARDGRIALYLADAMPTLWRPPGTHDLDARSAALLDALRTQGAMFFPALHGAAGGGYPGETIHALWRLVWSGVVTNDSFHALRAYGERRSRSSADGGHSSAVKHKAHLSPTTVPSHFTSRRKTPPSGEGRWSILPAARASLTEWAAATAAQLLRRYGILTREITASEHLPGGFSAMYGVLRAMEESGRVRRGYFASGVGAAQFAQPAALELLRSLKEDETDPEVVMLAATDPANPYGAILPWPPSDVASPRQPPMRTAGALVIITDGHLGAYVGRHGAPLFVFLPDDEPVRSRVARGVAASLHALALGGEGREGGLLIAEIGGASAETHALAPFLVEAGFTRSARGYHVRRV